MYLVYIIIRKENLYKRVYGLKNSLTKKCIRSIRWMSLCHLKDIKSSEGSQTHQKVFRKLDQKGDLQKDDLHVEDLTLKACFAWLMDIFKRSNLTRQRSKRELTLWKAGGPKQLVLQLVFLFGDVLICWERKQPTSLSSLRPVDIKKLWAQGLKSYQLDFEVNKNLEDEEEVAGTLLIANLYKHASFSTF